MLPISKEVEEFDEYVKKVGERIVQLRKERGLTQSDLAVKLNIEDSALRRIESGRTNPTLKTLHSIARALNTEITSILTGR